MPPLVIAAVNVVLAPLHIVVVAVLMVIVGAATGVTNIVIALLVAVSGAAQVALLVNTHVTTSLLFNVLDE